MIRRSWLPFVITPLPLVVAAIALYYFAPNEISYIDVILGLYALAFVAAIFWGRRSSVIVVLSALAAFLLTIVFADQAQLSRSDVTALVRGLLLLVFGMSILLALPRWVS